MPDSTVTISVQEYQALKGALRVVTVERDLLLEKLRVFQRQLFAAKSEAHVNSGQRDLFLNEAESLVSAKSAPAEEVVPETEIEVKGHARKPAGRKPLDPALPREVVRHELPASERICPHDGKELVEIGQEISEQLDIVPQQVRVIQHQRVKYACPCCDRTIKVTPAPVRLIQKGLFTESAQAWIVTSKFMDGLPLYRMAALVNRFGGDLSRSTLAATVIRLGQAVQPIINGLQDRLLQAGVVHGDETVVQVLKEGARKAQAKSYLWAQASSLGPPIRLFHYASTRATGYAATLYAGIAPGTVLITDGYEPYNALTHANQLVHLGCWAHVRRYFVQAHQSLPPKARNTHPANLFIEAIGVLFAIDANTQSATIQERHHARQTQSRAQLDRLQTLLAEHLHTVLPQSLFGKALHYLSHQWPKLNRYVEHGNWPISNNLIENAIRPFVVGRKNWLFCDTVQGAKASANLYSLIETAKAHRIDVYRYLVDLFKALPLAKTADDYDALMPWRLGVLSNQ